MLEEYQAGTLIAEDGFTGRLQSVYSRIAGYEDVNDAERLSQNPTIRLIGSERISALGSRRGPDFAVAVVRDRDAGRRGKLRGTDRSQPGRGRISIPQIDVCSLVTVLRHWHNRPAMLGWGNRTREKQKLSIIAAALTNRFAKNLQSARDSMPASAA
jgi:hypothetical protein